MSIEWISSCYVLSQREIYAPSEEIGLPGKKYAYKSEYDEKLAELRLKQRQMTATVAPPQPLQPVAGKPSKKPTTEETKAVASQYYHYDMGTSEYKEKFHEWPFPAAEHAVSAP